ncbi:MAG: prepilin peptidase [Alphaproteobacteria bacterium]
MTDLFLLIIFAYALVIMAVLFYIDLRTRLLPNRYVAQLFFSALAFHIISSFNYASFTDLLIAAGASIGLFLFIRAVGNKIYNTDTLGMGDVKLIGAAAIWLGSEYIFLAITIGALAGVIHGLGLKLFLHYKTGQSPKLDALSLPAGPGFISGIVLCMFFKFHTFILAAI